MYVLGISGSPRKEKHSGVNTIVRTVLDNINCETELISLYGKTIGGCVACLACVKDNICKIADDFGVLRQKIIEADAIVIGAPNYYSTLNATTHAFLERWFQFRHQTGNLLWGKLAVAVGVGGTSGKAPVDEIERFFLYNFIETVAKVTGQGAASCFSCGYGETCQVGIPVLLHGQGVKIKDSMLPDVSKQPEAMSSAAEAGRLLSQRLHHGHNRSIVAERMQKALMDKFGETA